MESLSRCLSFSPSFLTLKRTSKSHNFFPNNTTICNSPQPITEPKTLNHTIPRTTIFSNNFHKELTFLNPHQLLLKPHFSFLFLELSLPLSSFASEISTTEEVSSGRINLETILVSIDNFFHRYPFFVATITFIWLVVIPLTEEYLQKYKFISAINAFKKLKDDPDSQLLDIRDSKSLSYLGSPNLKFLKKTALQIDFHEGNEDGFVKRVLENVEEPGNTTLCIIDNFDGNSLKVAELLVKNGFKETYAVRGGIRGEKGWQEIQESLLPLSVHVYPKNTAKMRKQLDTNGAILQQDNKNNIDVPSTTISSAKNSIDEVNNGDLSLVSPSVQSKGGPRPSSPYPNKADSESN